MGDGLSEDRDESPCGWGRSGHRPSSASRASGLEQAATRSGWSPCRAVAILAPRDR